MSYVSDNPKVLDSLIGFQKEWVLMVDRANDINEKENKSKEDLQELEKLCKRLNNTLSNVNKYKRTSFIIHKNKLYEVVTEDLSHGEYIDTNRSYRYRTTLFDGVYMFGISLPWSYDISYNEEKEVIKWHKYALENIDKIIQENDEYFNSPIKLKIKHWEKLFKK